MSTVNSRIKSAKKRRKKKQAASKRRASKKLPIRKKKSARKQVNSRIKAARKSAKKTPVRQAPVRKAPVKAVAKKRSDAAKKGWETRRRKAAERVFASLPPREPPGPPGEGPPSEPPSSEKPISSRSQRLMEELEREREARREAEEALRKQTMEELAIRETLRRRAEEAELRWQEEMREKEEGPEGWVETDESIIYHRMTRAERIGLGNMEAAHLAVEFEKSLREIYEIARSPGKHGVSMDESILEVA